MNYLTRSAVACVMALGSLLLGLSPVSAQSLGGKVDDFTEEFNGAAREIGLDVTLVATDCSGAVRTCEFVARDVLAGIAMSEGDSGDLSGLMLFLGNDGDPLLFMASVGVTMAMYAPDVEAESRGAAMMEMLTRVTEDEEQGTALFNGVKWTMASSPVTGVIVTVSPVE